MFLRVKRKRRRDDNHASFSSGWSTADVVTIMVRVQESVDDCMRKVDEVSNKKLPVERLLHLKKAYT